jgi:autotransporter-associated beta strand protein
VNVGFPIVSHQRTAAAKTATIRIFVQALLLVAALVVPQAAQASCTPVTSTASPVTNSIVTCTGATLNQNMAMFLNTGYGTLNETGDTLVVQSLASVTGDSFGFALGDGNIVNNSGAVMGGVAGISTATGTNVTVDNLTATSTITGTTGEGLNVTNAIVSNAGTISGGSAGISATGSVVLASNTGSITGSGMNATGISANSVSGSNAGLISGATGIDTSLGTDINLSSNSGIIQGNGGFAINSNGNVFIGNNSGTIASDGMGTAFVRVINAGGNVTVTNTGNITATNALARFGDAIVAFGDATVVNSGSISGEGRAIDVQSNSSTSLNLMNNIGGSITGGGLDAVVAIGSGTITNAGTISSQSGNGVFVLNALSVTNTSTGIIESTGTSAEAIIGGALLLNNAGIVRVTATQFFAVDADTIATGSSNTGSITGNVAAINANDSIDMTNSGVISAGILAIQATNAIQFDNMGTVSADRRALVATDVSITNSGTIAATGGSGLQAIAIISTTATITNDASGVISATGSAANNDAINTSDTTSIDNAGLISSAGRSAIRVDSNASIINESGGTIIGVTGIVFRDATAMNVPVVNGTVFNAGTITGTGGTAINFAFTPGSGPMTLTLGPGSVINGLVLGTGGDIFQLGGKGSDTFDVDTIGATLQYQGFTAFNKVGSSIWTLTGTGAQNWSVISGTLIGDTNSLGAATYPVSAGATLEFKQDFDATYSGVVTGGGSFAKDGAGTLTLTGDNTFSGGTTILGGALQIGDGGTIGSIMGDVVDNGTLTFDRSDTVTFDGVISSIGNVNQNGAGTTILTAVNTFGSGTFINAGTLALSGAGSIANASDVVDGGTFDVSAATSGVSITSIEGNGRVILGANSLTLTAPTGFFAGVISGTGGLVLSGGTETLTGDNTYTGGTLINGARLNIGAGGKSGSIQGNVIDDGSLAFNRSNTITFGGAISGGGGVSQNGPGTTILTGFNTYMGGTTIAAGTLQIGNGGNAGFIIGNVVDNGALVFDRSDFTFGGAISGSGSVSQIGLGTTILAADSSYTGGTTIAAGTLQLGSGGTSGSIKGDVIDNGTLAFDRSDTLTFGGIISGTGSISQLGGGTTALTADNSYSGGTTISAGALQLGKGGTAGSIKGDVTDNGTLAFDRSDIVTLPV